MSNSDNKNFIPAISQPTKDKIVERLQNFEVFPFIRAYINKFGSSFSDSNFNYTFKVWFDSLQASNLSRRILVLRNFFLEDLDSIDLMGYRIRRLKNYEIRLLIGMGSYNASTPHYPLWNLPPDLKYDLNPMYCVEVPPLVFGTDNEGLSSESIRNRVLGLLMTFKDEMISMETELNYDSMEEFQINNGSSAISSWPELHHYFPIPYFLSHAEYDKLHEYEIHYAKIDLYKEKTLSLAIRRFLSATWRFSWEDILIDYMIALEALLSNTSQEIQYRISVGVAVLLDEKPSDRQRTFEIMKGFYDIRSKIVHGDADKLDKARDKLKRYFPEGSATAEDTLRQYIRNIIQKYVYLCSDATGGDIKKNFLKKLECKILGYK